MGMPFSSTGLWMRNVANAWQVYAITESAALLGLTFLFQGLPALIMGLFGGTLADIVDRRKLLLVGMSLEVCLALIQSAQERREIRLSHQVPIHPNYDNAPILAKEFER